MSLERAKRAAVAAAAVLAFTAFSGDARAAFNVKDFSCGTTPFSVNVDVSGLGSTDVCVTSVATVDLSCACVNNSGSCPQAANKATTPTTIQSAATIEPKNGRVHHDSQSPVQPDGCLLHGAGGMWFRADCETDRIYNSGLPAHIHTLPGAMRLYDRDPGRAIKLRPDECSALPGQER
jgi:hypothetical protein